MRTDMGTNIGFQFNQVALSSIGQIPSEEYSEASALYLRLDEMEICSFKSPMLHVEVGIQSFLFPSDR
jgi:hypothetical protein